MMAIDFKKRHKGKEVKGNITSQILNNSTKKLEVGDNHKELKREKGPKYLELEYALLA
jgi:hypothetical protein